METVENSAKNNCAEFSTVPTAPTTISLRRGKQDVRGEVGSESYGTRRSQKRKNNQVPATI